MPTECRSLNQLSQTQADQVSCIQDGVKEILIVIVQEVFFIGSHQDNDYVSYLFLY